jgi:hypothetical protein
MDVRVHGSVMWFNSKFGIGFIRPDDGALCILVKRPARSPTTAGDCERAS